MIKGNCTIFGTTPEFSLQYSVANARKHTDISVIAYDDIEIHEHQDSVYANKK